MSELAVGATVKLTNGLIGVVRYVGQTEFADGDWVGVELETDDGKNDGSVKGDRYFECAPGRGMFLRPAAAVVIRPAPAAKPTAPVPVKKPARPSSVGGPPAAKRVSTMTDTAVGKRMSINAPSPSPVTRSRPSSMLRSPTRSPTKQLSSATSTSSTPRTGTPSGARVPPVSTTKPRPSIAGSRTSMGPPPRPASQAARPSTTSAGNKTGVSTSKRVSLAPRPRLQVGDRVRSIGGQLSNARASDAGSGENTENEDRGASPLESEDTVSPKAMSPLSRTSAAIRSNTSDSGRSTASPVAQRGPGGSTAASREIEDLKTKLRLMDKKRMEDRDKLKGLEKVQVERDKLEGIIQKLQTKYQPQQQEITDLRKQLKEAEARTEELENEKAEHEIGVEMATLDREMAEETAEVLKTELDALKQKMEELELEVEVLREENAELGGEMSPEEKSSQGWLQMERNNERLREALIRLRDMTQQTESELRDEIKSLEEDARELGSVKEHYDVAKDKLAQSEAAIEDLRQQLDNALGAEDMIEELTERNMSMSEEIDELKATIEDLESLKELNDELEINHVETEKEMQEDIDFKDSIIAEQARRAEEQVKTMEDMEYTLSRFRELVTNLQSDLEDMKASHAMTETESEQLNSRSRAMMDLNMKLQVSAARTQVKTIDLELRRLDAQEAAEHLAIVQLFLPEAFNNYRDSVLALLRFKRVGFKANLLHGFVKERVNGQPPTGHEDDLFAGCDVLDKLSWVSAMCDRFVNAISHCTAEQFARFEGALYELEPVERALNGWIDGLRRDELNEKKCASELQRTIALMSHLAEVHISTGLASYADDVHMRTLVMQSHLENAAAALVAVRTMVQTIIPSQGDEDELAQHFSRKTDSVISNTRSAKVVVGKAVRALEELKTRSLSLMPDTIQNFEQCETATEDLAKFSRQIGDDLYTLLHEEGRIEPFTYSEVQNTVYRTASTLFLSSESDLFSTYSNKLRTLTTGLMDLATLASDLEMTQEFERASAPWVSRSQELRSSKTVHVDAEEEMRRLRDDNHERARVIAMKDQTLEEASVKIELLESRMRDAAKKNEKISELEKRIEDAKKRETELTEAIDSQNKELTSIEADRETWKKVAEDARALGVAAPGTKAGQEQAVATAREMDALKTEITSLQAAVRFLREDVRRARLTDPQNFDWLETPLVKPMTKAEERKALVLAEGKDVLNDLLNLASTAKVYDLTTMPKNRLAWRPAKATPQYHVARQRENYEAWSSWKDGVVKKARVLEERDLNRGIERKSRGALAARIHMHLPDLEGKGVRAGGEVDIVDPDDFEGLRGRLGFV
ncbi:CAP-Gly domain-containing protein [Drepanopeziza brunnea f. sp. 'multigermtubi' MB_m1]|uniref:CAP-Gly domain-containing protein n=1 Tax=Marssonina brunnea f. sp. multigermtubi (strain MB_m1) TaxID=1072389 RepID=K1X2E4_MARBU|nr:CAP-Gly domain-containing protein [Drepanopeziza brunnea f. sp. 'multigermtubi' MB_m1]EKD19406.1 CAP-Gly domain-containing protein [Drepanopeziza brunnea f. sp. 'multigermtubi' MB_m1]